MFGDIRIGYVLLISHIISCILVGVIFRNWKKNSIHSRAFSKKEQTRKEVSLRDLGEILGNSIRKSISTILNIGGFVVIFSVIISILNSSGILNSVGDFCDFINFPRELGTSIFSGMIELTNGVKSVSLLVHTNLSICIASFLIGFGGISVLLQVYSIVYKNNISIRPYLYGKLLQGLFAFFITAVLI